MSQSDEDEFLDSIPNAAEPHIDQRLNEICDSYQHCLDARGEIEDYLKEELGPSVEIEAFHYDENGNFNIIYSYDKD